MRLTRRLTARSLKKSGKNRWRWFYPRANAARLTGSMIRRELCPARLIFAFRKYPAASDGEQCNFKKRTRATMNGVNQAPFGDAWLSRRHRNLPAVARVKPWQKESWIDPMANSCRMTRGDSWVAQEAVRRFPAERLRGYPADEALLTFRRVNRTGDRTLSRPTIRHRNELCSPRVSC